MCREEILEELKLQIKIVEANNSFWLGNERLRKVACRRIEELTNELKTIP